MRRDSASRDDATDKDQGSQQERVSYGFASQTANHSQSCQDVYSPHEWRNELGEGDDVRPRDEVFIRVKHRNNPE